MVLEVPAALRTIGCDELDLRVVAVVHRHDGRPVEQRLQPVDELGAAVEAVLTAGQRGAAVLGQAALEQGPIVAVDRTEVAVLELPDALDLEQSLHRLSPFGVPSC